MELIAKAFTLQEEAHSAWEQNRYDIAKEKFAEVKDSLTNFVDSTDDKTSAKKVQKVITQIEEEITQLRKEELKRTSLINALKKCHTPEAPPADPDVWLPLPPKPSTAKKKGTPIQKKGETRPSGSQKPVVDRDKRPVRAGNSTEETEQGIADKNNLLDKWTATGEYEKSLVAVVMSMMAEGSPVAWDEILGLEQPKEVFRQTVILPALMPDYFTGIRSPARSVLLAGPPGSGKTLLAKAVATESKSTFFLVQTADLASKWRGDGEKLIKLLFAMARDHSPATIFFDEIDTIASHRGQDNEHEASRRLKAQLICEMDGFRSTDGEKILVLGATNFPWGIDEALRRRFEKRLFVSLPEIEARRSLLVNTFGNCPLGKDVNLDAVAAELEGYSPADIKIVCRQAAMAGISRLTRGMSLKDIEALKEQHINIPITSEDIKEAIGNVKSSVDPASLGKYADWFDTFGSA